jgi:hypothetical protein
MLRKLITLGLVAGLTKKAWDRYQASVSSKPAADDGNMPVRRKVKPAPSNTAGPTHTPTDNR